MSKDKLVEELIKENKEIREENKEIKAELISIKENIHQIITLLIEEKESKMKTKKLDLLKEESSDGENIIKDSTERNYDDKINKGELKKKKKLENEEVKFMKKQSKNKKDTDIDKEEIKEKDQNKGRHKESDEEKKSIFKNNYNLNKS